MSKYLIPLALFILGIIITGIGSIFKITHWPGANLMLLIGMLTEALAFIALIIVILKKNK